MIAKARRLRTFVVGSSKSPPIENDCYLIETSGHLCLYQGRKERERGRRKVIEAKVSRCFDEMVAIISMGVDLDDPTTNVRDIAP